MSIREWSTESGPLCFVCDQPIIASRRIVWEGSLSHISESIGFGDIQLHPECADWMASAMKRDVLEWHCGEQIAEKWYQAHQRPGRGGILHE